MEQEEQVWTDQSSMLTLKGSNSGLAAQGIPQSVPLPSSLRTLNSKTFPNFEVFPTELFDYNFMSPPHVDWVCHIPLACLLLNDFGFIKAMLFGNDGESLTHGLAHFSTFDYMFMPDLSGP